MSDAFFGPDAQQALLQRGHDMFMVVRDDAPFTYYGLSLVLPTAQTSPMQWSRPLPDFRERHITVV